MAIRTVSNWIARVVGRIGVRLLVINLLGLLVPIAGLEFARLHERQLLEGLERDMRDQAAIVRVVLEDDLARGVPLDDARHTAMLERAARRTRTRVRVLDRAGATMVDSHEKGPPEGPEPPPPHILPRPNPRARGEVPFHDMQRDPMDPNAWPEVPDRTEVKAALIDGHPGAHTRLRSRAPGVFLFVTEPIRDKTQIAGAVYVTRSTRPVLVELYKIRSGLIRVMLVALAFTGAVTLIFAWSISRPLAKLSRAAKRVAAGEPDVVIPVGGGGEIEELGASFASMKARLDARLKYISDFAADVAHEFKSPLTSIRGAAELLEEGAADDPDARRRFLRNIELDVARLDRLVSRLLELSRIEASNEVMNVVDLEELLRKVTERVTSPDQAVSLAYDAPARFLRARETDLETAMMNLLDNALRFSPEGKPPHVEVRGSNDEVEVRVIDHGPGIPPAIAPKIFDRFFTTDADRNGTGLGLAIVESVVRAHGGGIHIEDTSGGGATFVVKLPVRR